MWDDAPFPIPDFENQNLTQIEPIAEFIKTRLIGFYASFSTATDNEERHELVAQMTMCGASLSLLALAYLIERQSLIEMARELIRRTQT